MNLLYILKRTFLERDDLSKRSDKVSYYFISGAKSLGLRILRELTFYGNIALICL